MQGTLKVTPLHPDFRVPERKTNGAGGYDLYMPIEGAVAEGDEAKLWPLGFAMEVPPGHVGLLLPRSGAGHKFGVALRNTVGVIDEDYRGEVMASLAINPEVPGMGEGFKWDAGERLLQLVIVPITTPEIEVMGSLSGTERGAGGFGHTGQGEQ